MNAACVVVLESAPMPPTVWHIAVAALIGNAYGPVYDVASQEVRAGSRWSGPMGRAPSHRFDTDDVCIGCLVPAHLAVEPCDFSELR